MQLTTQKIDLDVAGRSWQMLVKPGLDTGDLHWNTVWPGAVGMSEYLAGPFRERLPGTRVLELGCGTGLVGLVAADLGAAVTLSDISGEALELARESAQLNGLSVSTRILDWAEAEAAAGDKWPVLLAADLIYYEPLFPDLLRAVDLLLADDGVALFSDPIRSPGTWFLQMAREQGFVYTQELLSPLVNRRETRVGIYRLWRERS